MNFQASRKKRHAAALRLPGTVTPPRIGGRRNLADFGVSGGCRGDCQTGRVTGGTAGQCWQSAARGATPPIKKVSRKFSHNDRQEGGYFQLSTDTFTVASNWIFSSAEVQKPITRRKISQNYALYVCFYVAISGIRQYIILLPIKMSQIIKQSGYELHVQENLDPGYDPGCHSLS